MCNLRTVDKRRALLQTSDVDDFVIVIYYVIYVIDNPANILLFSQTVPICDVHPKWAQQMVACKPTLSIDAFVYFVMYAKCQLHGYFALQYTNYIIIIS